MALIVREMGEMERDDRADPDEWGGTNLWR